MLIVLTVMVLVLAGALAWVKHGAVKAAHAAADRADEDRRKYADLHARFDRVAAEIHIQAREHVIAALAKTEDSDALNAATAAFDSLPKEPRTQAVLDSFAERVNITLAAGQVAQGSVQRAADEAIVVKAENSRLRAFLERAMSMPSDMPEARRRAIMDGINAHLSKPRADLAALADAEFRRYVEKHAEILGEQIGSVQ